jgi:PIN domain nuclease of toxin-antitoxin system
LRLLIDTHVLIWSVTSTAKLSARARSLLENASHERLFSAVSIWEVAIKAALRKPGFDVEANDLLASVLQAGFVELPVTARAASRVASLPLHHRDPFDRLLVAQAIEEDARLLTADATLALYGPNILTLA